MQVPTAIRRFGNLVCKIKARNEHVHETILNRKTNLTPRLLFKTCGFFLFRPLKVPERVASLEYSTSRTASSQSLSTPTAEKMLEGIETEREEEGEK